MKKYIVNNMGCGKCAQKIMDSLGKIDAIDDINVNLEEKSITLTFNNEIPDSEIINTLSLVGFETSIA